MLADLSALISARQPGLLGTLHGQLDALQRALLATQRDGHWTPRAAVPLAQRQARGRRHRRAARVPVHYA